MFRALRVDKTILQILEGTLRSLLLERWERVPSLRMIRMERGGDSRAGGEAGGDCSRGCGPRWWRGLR